MSAAEFLLQLAALGQRELHAGVHHAALADDHTQVVQRRIRPEDRIQQRGGQVGVQARAAFGDTTQTDLALDRDQRADLPPREERGRLDQRVNLVLQLAGPDAEQARLAQSQQRPAKLGLEDDDDREERKSQELRVEEVEAVQVEAGGQ